jgi:peroxiredoxin
MMKTFAVIAFIFFGFLCLAPSVQSSDTGNLKAQDLLGKKDAAAPPDFSLKDLSGKTRSLKDYRGKAVLLYFTTTWCPYCKRDIPNLKKLYASLKDKDFELVAIYINESQKKVASFATRYTLPYPVLLDTDASVARTYGIRGVPTKILLHKDGSIACWPCSAAEEKIDDLLKEK